MGTLIALFLLLAGNAAFATTQCEGELDYRTEPCAMSVFDTVKGSGAKEVITDQGRAKGGTYGSKYVIGKYQAMNLKCTSSWSAGGRSAFAECEIHNPKLLRAVMNDVMIKAAVRQARSFGETCTGKILSSDNKDETFEAQINCSEPATKYTGGGTVLMINVKAREISDSLDDIKITVQKAG